jgi:murein DD-endopeptidase MepM/ murein hydrolase activator NlpD
MHETTLPPVTPPPQDYRVVGRDPSPAPGPRPRPEAWAKAPDRAPPPWSDRGVPLSDRSPPPWTDRDPPPWTDRDPFPWPELMAGKHKHAPGSEQPAAWQGRHVMQTGESLYAIARRHKVSVDELRRVNGITDTTKVWAGKVLAVPERPGAAATPPSASTPPRVVQVTPRVVSPPAEPQAEPQAAPHTAPKAAPEPAPARKYEAKMGDGIPAPAVAAGKFRWPARGKVIVGFGSQPDGSKSDGINLAVPLGTDIHAAEAGRVHYVGDGLKGYGNLILIRHDNGWVSAYAHADQILVKAGDAVRRGQVIGKAGKSGPVAQPQLRFELRKGSVPVDPLPHLAN